MKLFLSMLHKRKILCALSICASGLTAVATLGWNAQLIDIINTVGTGTVPAMSLIFLALDTMLMMSMASFIKGCITGYTCENITHDLRMGYARYFAALPLVEAEQLNAGEQLSKLQNEIAGVSGYLNANLFQLMDDVIRFIATFVWLLSINTTLTLTANLPVFFLIAYVCWSSKIIGSATLLSQQAKGEMNQYADTLLVLFPIIRLYESASLLSGRYVTAVNTWEKQTIRTERLRARLMSLSALMSSTPLLFLFLIGGNMAINGTLTIGMLYIFVNLSGNVSGVLMNMPGYIGAFRQFSANMKRLEGKICLSL